MNRPRYVEFISALLILLFAYTGLSKLMTGDELFNAVNSLPLIGSSALLISWLLPITELLIVLLLFTKKWRGMGLWASLVLLSLFTGYLVWMLLTNSKLPCRCGGVIDSLSWPAHVVFNIGFIVFTVIGIQMERKFFRNSILSIVKTDSE